MNRPLLVAAILIFALAVAIWNHAGRPRRERLSRRDRLTLKEQALLVMIRAGYFRDADEPERQDQPRWVPWDFDGGQP